jgi:hypothetical protein
MAISSAFALVGSWTSTPNIGFPSGFAVNATPLNEIQQFIEQTGPQSYELDSDSPQAVAFGGVTGATVLIVKAVGGSVKVTITSSAGSSQVIPVDSFLLIMTDSTTPITAVSLTRSPGVVTTCSVFLGQSQ